MLREMTANQFREWARFAEIEPFRFDPELRADYRAALVAQVIANVNRGSKQQAYKLADFLIKFEDESKPAENKSWKDLQKVAYQIVDIYNAAGLTDPMPER